MKSKTIYLYRHGETNWNIEGRAMGQLEGIYTEFTINGYNQIISLSEKLKDNNIQAIYCSDFKRTFDTANIASKDLKISIIQCKELRGLNMGRYHGKLFSEFMGEEEIQKCFKDYSLPIGGGESINQLNERIVTAIKKICSKTEYERIAIITHSAVISNLRAYLSKDKYISSCECTVQLKNNTLSVLHYTQNYNIKLYNDLILVRHAENAVDDNISNDMLPLTDRGIRQAEAVAKKLENKFDVAFSSTSKRAIMTAKIISGRDSIEDSRLVERGWGNERRDGKETDREAKMRFANFIKDAEEKYKEKRLLIISHGALIKLAQDVIEDNCTRRDNVNNCTTIVYNKDKQKIIIE